jgi:hypothetical protein
MRLMKVARGPRRVVRFSAPSAVLILGLVAGATARAPSTIEVEVVAKPRVIVLTDITNEPDDQQSLVRFLVYSNEFDVEGIVATTSTWLRNQVRPTESSNWWRLTAGCGTISFGTHPAIRRRNIFFRSPKPTSRFTDWTESAKARARTAPD